MDAAGAGGVVGRRQAARAAELRLRAQCAVSGRLVELGDVAEIVGGDPQQAEGLAAIELFPAPPAASNASSASASFRTCSCCTA